MKKKTTSKASDLLRSLGFRQLTEEAEAYIDDRVDRRVEQLHGRPLNRRERRVVAKIKKHVTALKFIAFQHGTETSIQASDESGVHWRVAPATLEIRTKLLGAGFRDDTAAAQLIALWPPLAPEKTH